MIRGRLLAFNRLVLGEDMKIIIDKELEFRSFVVANGAVLSSISSRVVDDAYSSSGGGGFNIVADEGGVLLDFEFFLNQDKELNEIVDLVHVPESSVNSVHLDPGAELFWGFFEELGIFQILFSNERPRSKVSTADGMISLGLGEGGRVLVVQCAKTESDPDSLKESSWINAVSKGCGQ